MDSGILVAILVPMSMFAMIFGIFYVRSQERMGMIERGMDPRSSVSKPFNHSYTLTAGMLLIGAGFGLFLADWISQVSVGNEDTATYLSLTTLFGGVGLLAAYFIEKKSAKKED